MTGPYFVDSNVLVYARDVVDEAKRVRALAWLEFLWRSGDGRLSVQVLDELYATVTRGRPSAEIVRAAREDCAALALWSPEPLDFALIERAQSVQDRFRFDWWDCLIVAAAQRIGCRILLSEDLQAGQTLDRLTVVNPFDREPPALR